MPYFNTNIYGYVCNLSIIVVSLENIRMPQNVTIVNFEQPVSKSWVKLCNICIWKENI